MKVVLIVLTLMSFHIKIAGGEELEKLSLEEALKIAFINNPEIVTAEKNIESARARVVQALAYPNPELETVMKNPSGGVEVEVSQELELFGKRTLRGNMARNEIKIYESELELIHLGVSFKVKESYAQILLARKIEELAEESLNLTRKFLDKVREKFNLGEVLRSELLRAEIEMFYAQNELLVAEKDLSLNKAKLNILLGRSVSHKFVCTDEFVYKERRFDLDTLIKNALINRPDLKAKKLMLDSKNMEVKLMRKERFANPSVGFWAEREDREQRLGVTLGIPLPFWYRKQGEIAEARNESQKIEYQINFLKRQIELEVNNAFGEVVLSDRQVALMEKSVKKGSELIRLIEMQYAEGKTDFLTYLEVLTTFKGTRLSYFRSILDHQIKLAILEKTTGGEL
ncbi:MAG: Cobalt-zinc-cadmium resistance protein CzcC [Dehalococcoidia bacterium]|nr:Cobalt-zinc-cadmium resistance protein CzcC [Bacillota bacterium]